MDQLPDPVVESLDSTLNLDEEHGLSSQDVGSGGHESQELGGFLEA